MPNAWATGIFGPDSRRSPRIRRIKNVARVAHRMSLYCPFPSLGSRVFVYLSSKASKAQVASLTCAER